MINNLLMDLLKFALLFYIFTLLNFFVLEEVVLEHEP